MKRLLSWLLALVMIISCLPLSALPAFATEGDPEVDVEVTTTADDDFTVEMDELSKGMESNPIDLTVDLLYQEDFSATVTVPAGKTIWYTARIAGMIMSINGAEGELMEGDTNNWPVFSIKNDGEADAEYVIVVNYPVGTQANPAELVLNENNVAEIEAGNNQGYYFTYTAAGDDVLKLTISAADAEGNELGWTYAVVNTTTNVAGDTQWSDSDPVVNPAEIEVAAGQELQIMVNTYDPADMWNNPAGIVTVYAEIVAGSESSPIFLNKLENTVTNAGTLYYQGYFSGTVMTIIGADAAVYNGENLTADENGAFSTAVTSPNPRMPVVVAVTGDGEVQINFAYPEGSQNNPAILQLGNNSATFEAGAGEYYYNWTAEEDGTLTITMPSDMAWQYTINNMTTYSYGDTQWSDSDPVVNPAVVEVAKGDVIEVKVLTYDAANPWAAPAGTLTFNASFKAAVVENTIEADLAETQEATSAANEINTYIYTATADGTVTVVANGENVTVNGTTVSGTYDVVAGDKLTVVVSAGSSAKITFEASIVAPEVPVGTIPLSSATLEFESVVYINIKSKVTGFTGIDLEEKMGLMIWTGDDTGYDKAYMTENMLMGNENVTVVPGAVKSGSSYVFQTPGIYAKNLGEEQYMRLYVEYADGYYVYSNVTYYGPQVYALDRLKNGTDENLKRALVAMLDYAAASQNYFDYNVDDLANNIDETYLNNYRTSYDASFIQSVVSADSAIVGDWTRDKVNCPTVTPSLLLEDIITNQYKFKFTSSIMSSVETAQLLFWDSATYANLLAAGEAFSADNASYAIEEMEYIGGYYIGGYNKTAVKNLGDSLYLCAVVTTTSGDTYYSGVISHSAHAYLKDRISNSTDAEMVELSKCLAVYCDTAKVYFANKA